MIIITITYYTRTDTRIITIFQIVPRINIRHISLTAQRIALAVGQHFITIGFLDQLIPLQMGRNPISPPLKV